MPLGRVLTEHLVTGATGTIGRQVLSQLPATGAEVRALTRCPDAARSGVTTKTSPARRGSSSRPDTDVRCLVISVAACRRSV